MVRNLQHQKITEWNESEGPDVALRVSFTLTHLLNLPQIWCEHTPRGPAYVRAVIFWKNASFNYEGPTA